MEAPDNQFGDLSQKQAKFAHFDLGRLVWHKHDTKGIKLSRATYEYAYRSVPIHPRVAAIVRAQRERWPNAELVFPSQVDPSQPRDNFRKPLARFKRLEGVPAHFQLYDLKRIAISLMLVGQGVPREDVSHLADHRGRLSTTRIYDLGFVKAMETRLNAQGITNVHGLRHAYAQRRYHELTGRACPKNGGPKQQSLLGTELRADRQARGVISRELGHNRLAITTAYLG